MQVVSLSTGNSMDMQDISFLLPAVWIVQGVSLSFASSMDCAEGYNDYDFF